MNDHLTPENHTLFQRIWGEEVAAGRRSYWLALNRLIDAARDEGEAKGRRVAELASDGDPTVTPRQFDGIMPMVRDDSVPPGQVHFVRPTGERLATIINVEPPTRGPPDPDCRECSGTGELMAPNADKVVPCLCRPIL